MWTSKGPTLKHFRNSVLWYHITPLCDYTKYIMQGWGRGLPSPSPVLDHLFAFGLIIILSNEKTGRILVNFLFVFWTGAFFFFLPFWISLKFYILRAVCTESTDCWLDIVINPPSLPDLWQNLRWVFLDTLSSNVHSFDVGYYLCSVFWRSFSESEFSSDTTIAVVAEWLLAGFFYTK